MYLRTDHLNRSCHFESFGFLVRISLSELLFLASRCNDKVYKKLQKTAHKIFGSRDGRSLIYPVLISISSDISSCLGVTPCFWAIFHDRYLI